MLSNLSWSEYLGAVVILIVLYYGYIGFRYYREDIKAFLRGRTSKGSSNADNAGKKQPVASQPDQGSFDELEMVTNDLRIAVLEKAGKGAFKPELLAQIKQRLADYAGLQKPAFRLAINNFLIVNAKDICGVVFSESELNAAWESLLR